MSLIKCPECNKEISDTLNQCIHCGYFFKKDTDNPSEEKDNPSEKKGKVTIHGYNSKNIVNPTIKIYDNDILVGEVRKNQTIEYFISKDTTLTFRSFMNTCNVDVSSNVNTEITIIYDDFKGVLKAIPSIEGEEDDDNIENEQQYQKPLFNYKIKVISVVCVVIAAVFMITLLYMQPVTESSACQIVQKYVREEMRNPNSAIFSDDCTVVKDEENENIWYVTGTVRGENGFGGMTTGTYTVRMVVDDNKYSITYTTID